ncbi:hypothetical protein LVJ94_41820 [Pendulispora rubella]|uniref:ABM domain-containing protein n=1 Tax=Pendulispora rubella TaxID=2741070 RepID=A0ABZ2L2F5_9BACT
MPSAEPPHAHATFVSIERVAVHDAAAAARVIDDATTRGSVFRATEGFLGDQIHQSADHHTVIHRVEWASEAAAAASGIRAVSAFLGWTAPALHGPNDTDVPGVASLATRHLRGRESYDALLALMAQSGAWKRNFPGFIFAIPHLGLDGRTFVMYTAWVDHSAYRAWISDPRLSVGQEEIARLEVAPPEYLLCEIVTNSHRAIRGPSRT